MNVIELLNAIDGNINEIDKKSELTFLLSSYKNVLDVSKYNYLNELINLNRSAINDLINNNNYQLNDLAIYKRILVYNNYNRVLELFRTSESLLNVIKNINGKEYLKVTAFNKNNDINIYDFIASKDEVIISLYQSIENNVMVEKELNRVAYKLENLYDEVNPYKDNVELKEKWDIKHNIKIKEYESLMINLYNKNGLSELEKNEIMIRNTYYNLLMKEYGLKDNDFIVDNKINSEVIPKEETELRKVLIKKLPGLKIINNINYL